MFAKPIFNKIRTLISLFTLERTDDTKRPQEIKMTSLGGEAEIIEHFQPFGLSGRPPSGSIGIMLSVGGNRSHGVAICIDGNDVTVENLMDGETAVYNSHGKKIVLKQDRIEVTGDIMVTGNINATGDISATGDVNATGDVVAGSISLKRHTHSISAVYVFPPPATPTPPPTATGFLASSTTGLPT